MNCKHLCVSDLVRLIVLILFVSGLSLMEAQAQRQYGDIGIGAQVGQPTGLTVKIYRPTTSIDFLAAWDWDDFFFLNVHGIFDHSLNDKHTIHFFYGPGGFVGLRDREGIDDEVELGLSGSFGIDFLIDRLEIFAQATPRLALVKATNFDMGGGVGIRIYL